MKLQQYTGPVQAKGLEDTAFYRYNVLLSINEVGGDPGRFGRSVAEFHEASAAAPAPLAAGDADDGDARHEARRRRAGADQCDLGAVRRVDARGRQVDAPESRAPHADRRRTGAGSQRRVPLLSGARRLLAARRRRRPPGARGSRRAAAGIHAQGRARGQGAHQLADAESAVRGRARRLRRARAHRRRRPAVRAGHARVCRIGSPPSG